MTRNVFRALGAALLVLALLALGCQKKPAGTAAATDSVTTSDRYKAEPAPALVVANQAGQKAFLAYCAMCHGDRGGGDGPLSAELTKLAGATPINLTDATRLNELGRAGVKRVIETGGAHSQKSNLMPAWGEKLEPALVDSITDYVMILPAISPSTPSATLEKYMEAPPGTPEEGRRLFVYYCTGCHGPEGKGDGFNAERLRKEHNIRPRNLTDSTYIATLTDQQIYVAVSLGGGHSGKSAFMPAWTGTLTPAQIKDLVAYVRAISHTQAH